MRISDWSSDVCSSDLFSKKESIASEILRRWTDAVSTTVEKAAATGQPADRQILMIYRELAYRAQNEPIIRAGVVLSVEPSLNDANATSSDARRARKECVSTSIAR